MEERDSGPISISSGRDLNHPMEALEAMPTAAAGGTSNPAATMPATTAVARKATTLPKTEVDSESEFLRDAIAPVYKP